MFVPVRRQRKLCLRVDPRRVRMAHAPVRPAGARRESRGLPPRPRRRGTRPTRSRPANRCYFNLGTAYELYTELLGPVDALIKDKRNLAVVPSGALTASAVSSAGDREAAGGACRTPRTCPAYRDAAWLLKRHAVTRAAVGCEPEGAAAGCQRADRGRSRSSASAIRFFSDGAAPSGDQRGARTSAPRPAATTNSGAASASIAAGSPGIAAAAGYRRRDQEHRGQARGVCRRHLSRQRRPARPRSSTRRLSDYRVVYFATHGLVAGDVKGLGEPALALTIPTNPTDARRRPADGERGGAAQAQRRLGRAVGLQHDGRRNAGRRSAVGAGAGVLLCRHPRAVGLALDGRLRKPRRG